VALVGRILVVLFAFAMASLAAAAVMIFGYLVPGWSEPSDPPVLFHGLAVVIAFTAVLIAGSMLLPAMLIITIAEGLRLRSMLLYAVVGGIAGLVSYYAGVSPMGHPDAVDAGVALPREAEIITAAGIAAGFVYWTLAGRNAGRWQRSGTAGQGAVRT
jgi:hypothetical protein